MIAESLIKSYCILIPYCSLTFKSLFKTLLYIHICIKFENVFNTFMVCVFKIGLLMTTCGNKNQSSKLKSPKTKYKTGAEQKQTSKNIEVGLGVKLRSEHPLLTYQTCHMLFVIIKNYL